jgi:hypothetical protein
LLLYKYYSGDQIEEKEMGEACDKYGDRRDTGFWWGYLMEKNHVEDPGVGGRVILKYILNK